MYNTKRWFLNVPWIWMSCAIQCTWRHHRATWCPEDAHCTRWWRRALPIFHHRVHLEAPVGATSTLSPAYTTRIQAIYFKLCIIADNTEQNDSWTIKLSTNLEGRFSECWKCISDADHEDSKCEDHSTKIYEKNISIWFWMACGDLGANLHNSRYLVKPSQCKDGILTFRMNTLVSPEDASWIPMGSSTDMRMISTTR